jgi:hypothetical protein
VWKLRARTAKRPVLLHLHTYKNAGTTVDAILRQCFGSEWFAFDGPTPDFYIHQSEVTVLAERRPWLKAISTHHARLPVPESPTVEFLPILFIRHPLLRAASVWRFERQRKDQSAATLTAQSHQFRDWVEVMLASDRNDEICESQTRLFSFRANARPPDDEAPHSRRAIRNLKRIPAVGVVEQFDRSMKLLRNLYESKRPEFIEVPVEPKNRLSANYDFDQQLEQLGVELGGPLMAELQARNASDLALYRWAVANLDRVATS